MGLKEILAAKKAAEEAANKSPAMAPAVTEVPEAKLEAPVSVLQDAAPVETPTEPAKPLTFAEKMALKKQGIQQAQSAPPPPPKITKLEIPPEDIPEDPEIAQAYVDIKQRIHELELRFDDDLRNAMSELKAALKKNPAACELMLDSDLGKMVIALRRMTNQTIVEAEKEKKPGRKAKEPKAKEVQLTKEQIEAAFAEL